MVFIALSADELRETQPISITLCGGVMTGHGFRGLASTWANEAECYRSDWIETALAHADRDDVRSAYNSALYLTPRRRMLEDWAEVVAGMIDGAMNIGSDVDMAPAWRDLGRKLPGSL